jgi:hypothetical protein
VQPGSLRTIKLTSTNEADMRWHEEGTDPDYRFSLANERTFLAWIRTALAILAGAVLLKQFATLPSTLPISPAGSGTRPHCCSSACCCRRFLWQRVDGSSLKSLMRATASAIGPSEPMSDPEREPFGVDIIGSR